MVWRVACYTFLQVLASSRQCAKGHPCPPKGIVGDDRKFGVVHTLRQAQQRFPEFARRVPLWLSRTKPPQPIQDREQFWCLTHLLAQRICLGVSLLYLGRCKPLGQL